MDEQGAVARVNGWPRFIFAPKAGRVVDAIGKAKALTVDGALRRGGLEWETQLVPALAQTDAGNMPVPRQFATVRSDTLQPLGVVGTSYQPLGNAEWLGFYAEALQGTEASIIGAGATRGGSRVFAILRVGEDVFVGGDEGEALTRLVIASTSHDGSRLNEAVAMALRGACWNGLSIALAGTVARYAWKHTTNAKLFVAEARAALQVEDVYAAALKAEAERMLAAKMTKAEVRAFLHALKPVPDDEGKARTIALNLHDAIMAEAAAPDLRNVAGTRYGMLQAVTAWCDHVARTRVTDGQNEADLRFERAIAPNAVKQQAYNLLRVAA